MLPVTSKLAIIFLPGINQNLVFERNLRNFICFFLKCYRMYDGHNGKDAWSQYSMNE